MLDKTNDPPYFVHHKDRFWVGMMFIVYIEEMMFRTKFGNEIYRLHLLFHKDFWSTQYFRSNMEKKLAMKFIDFICRFLKILEYTVFPFLKDPL